MKRKKIITPAQKKVDFPNSIYMTGMLNRGFCAAFPTALEAVDDRYNDEDTATVAEYQLVKITRVKLERVLTQLKTKKITCPKTS